MKKRLFTSSAELGAVLVMVCAITGASVPRSGAAEPMRLGTAEMDRVTAGAILNLVTAVSASGITATAESRQSQEGKTVGGNAVVVFGHGVALASADGSQTSGRTRLRAYASGDVAPVGFVGGVVNVPSKTVVYGATWGVAVDLPLGRP